MTEDKVLQLTELYERLDTADTEDELKETAEKILELDPKNACGRLALWKSMDIDEAVDNLELLEDALEEQRAHVQAMDAMPSVSDSRDAQVYGSMLLNLAQSYLSLAWADDENPDLDREEQALELGRELLQLDKKEEFFPARDLIYRCMLDLQMYNDIFRMLEDEDEPSVMGEHARVMAMLETGADAGEVRDAMLYAMSLAPDVPTLLLGIWDMPEDDNADEDEELTAMYANYLAVPWCSSERRITTISVPAFLFCYLTDRLEDKKEIKALEECYETLGILDEVREAKERIQALPAEETQLEEIDSYALGETVQLVEKMAEKE